MIRNLLTKVFYFFMVTGLITACSDDPYYGNGYDSEFNNLYSNKSTSQPGSGALKLSYSGYDYSGREAYFEMQTSTTANIKLFKVLPSENETLIKDIKLTASSSGGYSFTGNSTSTGGTTFTYSGSMEGDALSLALTNVKIPNYPFANGGVFETKNYSVGSTQTIFNVTTPLKLNWITEDNGVLYDLLAVYTASGLDVGAILGKLIYLVLPQLTFHEDGNITAQYSGLQEGIDIMSLMTNPVTEDNRMEIITLPRNLLFYSIKDNTATVQLNLEGLMGYILYVSQSGDSTSDGLQLTDMLDLILELYPAITNWVQNGIKFNLEANDPTVPEYVYPISSNANYFFYYMCDYKIYADKYELGPVLQKMPEIFAALENMGISLTLEIPIGDFVFPLDISELLLEMLPRTTDFNLGFYLSY